MALTYFILQKLKGKMGFLFSYAICIAAVFCVMIGQWNDSNFMLIIGILFTKLGNSVAFCYFYFCTMEFFSNQYLGLVMGICNVLGRFSNILAPMAAEKDPPFPMMCCVGITCLAGFLSFML